MCAKAVEEIRKEGEDRGKIMAYMDMGCQYGRDSSKIKDYTGRNKRDS